MEIERERERVEKEKEEEEEERAGPKPYRSPERLEENVVLFSQVITGL